MRSWGKFSIPEPIFEDQTKRKKVVQMELRKIWRKSKGTVTSPSNKPSLEYILFSFLIFKTDSPGC